MSAIRRITIRVRRTGDFDVIESGHVAHRLNFDEMLGQIVSLTYRGSKGHYRMETAAEMIGAARKRRERIREREEGTS